jgi:hypothetical protein
MILEYVWLKLLQFAINALFRYYPSFLAKFGFRPNEFRFSWSASASKTTRPGWASDRHGPPARCWSVSDAFGAVDDEVTAIHRHHELWLARFSQSAQQPPRALWVADSQTLSGRVGETPVAWAC